MSTQLKSILDQLEESKNKGQNFIKFNVFIIKHLHQLQNLYFALTGIELKIEL